MMNDATNYAKSQADIFKQSLQYLVEQQNQQKILDEQALNQRYADLVNQINQKRLPIEQQYGQDTQGIYVNKMLGGEQIRQNLSRMGLNSSGFGLTQQALNEASYGQNLNQLMMNRNNQLTGLENQITNLQGQQQSDMLGLQSTYAGRLGDLNKYIGESVNNKYQQEYSNYMAQKQYEDQLKQQAIDNAYRVKALNASGGGGGDLFTDSPKITPTNDEPINNAPTLDPNKPLKITSSPARLSSKAALNYYYKNVVNNMTYTQLDKHLGDGLAQNIYTQDDVLRIISLIEKMNQSYSSTKTSGGGGGGGGGF